METYDAWLKIPFVIAVWNPRTRAASRRILLAAGVAAKWLRDPSERAEWYGMRVEATDTNTDVALYPEDNLMEMREKIYIATGIPVYRQHIWIEDGGKGVTAVRTTYSIFTDAPVTVNIKSIGDGDNMESISGLPVDRSIYAARDYVHITAGDTFSLVSQWAPAGGTIWIADMDSWMAPLATQMSAMIGDKYMLDLIYWGFVAKYWPMITPEVFAVYATGESNLRSAFPTIARSLTDMRRKYEAERRLVQQRYSLAHKARTMKRTVSITQFTASVTSLSVHLNIRNVFELSRVSDDVPQITAYVDAGEGRRVRLVRALHDAPPTEPPNTAAFMNGIVFALRRDDVRTGSQAKHGGAISPLTGDYLWLAIHPNGKYHIRGTWHEMAGMDFEDIYTVLDRYISPQIRTINGFGRIAFNTGIALESVSHETLSFHGLNVSVAWKQPVTPPTFRILRGSWDEMSAADIAVIRPSVLHDRFDLTYRKGIYAHDSSKIDSVIAMAGGDLRNQYSYLSSPLVAKKWQQNYGGRTCSISMRESDVRIDVIDIREDEFRGVFLDYMFAHLWTVVHSDAFARAAPSGAIGRPVRRLRDADPKLYNLAKYGVSRKYSQICQGPHQPIIVDNNTPAKLAKNAVKYWNFTQERPVHYACPNPKYPYLSFITKTHPAGYCLPCCNKRSAEGTAPYASCIRDKSWKSDDEISEHVLAYGKIIPEGRYSHPHPGVAEMIPESLLAYVEVVPTASPDWRILHALAGALEVDVATVSKRLSRAISAAWASFGPNAIAGRDRATLLREFTTGPRAIGVDWAEIISYAAVAEYNCGIIIFDDSYDKLSIRVPQATIDSDGIRYALISLSPTAAYPIYDTTRRIYPADMAAVRSIMSAAARLTTRYMDLAAVRRVPGWTITRKYVNLQNMCYAVEVSRNGITAYIAITYSAHTSDGIAVDTAGWDGATPADGGAAAEFIGSIGGGSDNVRIVGIAEWGGGTKSRALIVHADGAALYCYYNSGAPPDLPLVHLDYDPPALTRALLRRAAGTVDAAEDERVGREQYRMSIYNALLMHVGEYMRSERNTEMREKIISVARTPDQLTTLGLSATDLGVIRATLQFAGIKGLTKRLGSAFDFDMISMAKIAEAPSRTAAIDILRGIVSKVATPGKGSTTPLPNVYTTCSARPDQPFCAKDGLLTVEGLEDLLPVLADAMRNPLRAATLFGDAWNNNVIDRMSFTRYGNDRIIAFEI